jgi:hypothetical protein
VKTAVAVLLLAVSAFAQRQRISHYELRPAADGLRLYITIDGEDRLISNRATRAWDGWTPQFIIYSERMDQDAAEQRLRWYDAFTRNAFTLSAGEKLEYTDVSHVRLSNGDYVLLISLRDPDSKAPWVELAGPKRGVFLREQYAAWGTVTGDRAQLRRYLPQDIERTKGDISLLAPDIIASISLIPPATVDAAGLYEYRDTGRTVTLNLRPGGKGTLIVQSEGKEEPVARQGTWTQVGSEVRFGEMSWVTGVNGLTPKEWDRKEWGAVGLPLRRAVATAPVPGTVTR